MRTLSLLGLLLGLLLLWGPLIACAYAPIKAARPGGTPSPFADQITVSWEPYNGAKREINGRLFLRGVIDVTVDASALGAARLVVQIDDQVVGNSTWFTLLSNKSSIMEFRWYTSRNTPDGNHTMVVEAYDSEGGLIGRSSWEVYTDNSRPRITKVDYVKPGPGEPGLVIVSAEDNLSGIDNITLSFSAGSAEGQQVFIVGGKKSCTVSFTIPGLPNGTKVDYYVRAVDMLGLPSYIKHGSYIVGEEVRDTEGPKIIEVRIEPSQPGAYQDVKVMAWLSDASGLDVVILDYSVDGGKTWRSINMKKVGNHYEGTIPGQPGGTLVRFRIRARDKVGNESESPIYLFKVMPATNVSVLVGIIPVVTAIAASAKILKRTHGGRGRPK